MRLSPVSTLVTAGFCAVAFAYAANSAQAQAIKRGALAGLNPFSLAGGVGLLLSANFWSAFARSGGSLFMSSWMMLGFSPLPLGPSSSARAVPTTAGSGCSRCALFSL